MKNQRTISRFSFLITLFILGIFFFSTSPVSAGTITTTLRYGMKDIQVKYLQEFLNEKGYTVATTGIGSKGQESTYFGPATLNAVKAYQRAHNLTADGIFGAKSRATLGEGGTNNTTYTNNNTTNTSTTNNNTSYKQGCTATTLYSATTGLPCKETSNTSLPTGCTSTSLYSATTGQRCNQTTTTTTYKPGCTATTLYSRTTGLSCTTNTTTGGGTTGGGGGGGGSKGTDDKKTSNTSPTISISTNNTSFTSPASITISATASDSDGTISKVDFYNGSTLLYTDTTSPYAFSWTSVPTGTYTLKAIATDNSNATTTSSTVKVTVSSTTNESISQLNITSVLDTADTHESTNPIVNTYDNSLTTRWAARQASNNGTNNVGIDIVFDLGATQNVSQTKLSFYQWNASRIYQYNIALSTNSTSWTTVVDNKSSSATQFTTDTFTATNARYVRVKFISQNQGSWAGLYEAQILGKTLISLPSNTPPTISISTSNTSFTSPANITISATASDTDGTISKVDFYNGSTLIHSDTTSPYTFAWTSVPTGTYTLKAVATDNSNASTTSSTKTITVQTEIVKIKETARIMPLGDSITEGIAGSNDDVGYRRKLYKDLISAGYDVDFVGTQNTGLVSDFDKDNDGHGGWHADLSERSIATNVYSFLNQTSPNIILLHIGTNDLKWEEPSVTVSDVNRILNNIDKWESDNNKKIHVILAKIIKSTVGYSENGVEHISAALRAQRIIEFNGLLETLAQDRINNGDSLKLMDMYSKLNYPGDLVDGTHPNQTGYDKMADAWFSELENILTKNSTSSLCPAGSVYVKGDFEGTGDTGWNMVHNAAESHSINIVSSLSRTGSHSIRTEQRCEDKLMANGHRAEIFPNSPTEYVVHDPIGSERWYGFSVYLPSDFNTNPADYSTYLIMAQWHGTADEDLGELNISPPLALSFSGEHSPNVPSWVIHKLWDSKPVSTNYTVGVKRYVFGDNRDDLGKWTDWVFHVKWSYNNDGLLEVWKNGVKVVDDIGPIGFNDKQGIYFKSGIYRGGSTYCPIVTYIDTFKFANEKGSYSCVAP